LKYPKVTEMGSYSLKQIAIVKSKNGQGQIRILPKYIKAMKNCELFSHLIVLWRAKGDISGTGKNIGYRGILPVSTGDTARLINISTSNITEVDTKNGLMGFISDSIPSGAIVLDIKAHIPVSDRVKSAVIPDDLSYPMNFIPEEKTGCEKVPFVPNMGKITNPPMETEIDSIGIMKKTDGRTEIRLNQPFAGSLKHLSAYSHARILWWFHRLEGERFRRTLQVNPPYERAPRTGVFATRSPVRPNPLGLTTVRIEKAEVETGTLVVKGFDGFPGTPIIDIVPYIPYFDRVRYFRVPDWFKHWPPFMVDEEALDVANPRILRSSDRRRLVDENIPGHAESVGGPVAQERIEKVQNNEGLEKHDTTKGKRENSIRIIGARQNNLKNMNVSIPHNRLTVITGISGSGKSSLAFDTLYAEGHYRFVKSMSTSARQLADQMEEPDVDQIHGLLPTVAIEQRTAARNPRSTVGSVTDMYGLLRLLFSKVGTRYCPTCARAVEPQSPGELAKLILTAPPGTTVSVAAQEQADNVNDVNVIQDGTGEMKNVSESILQFTVPEADSPELKNKRSELVEDLQRAYDKGNGFLIIRLDGDREYRFCQRNACPYCRSFFFEMNPSMFNSNNPDGMCTHCEGRGKRHEVDPEEVIDKPEQSLLDGASRWFGVLRKMKPTGNWMRAELFAMADIFGIDLETPWNRLPEAFRSKVLYGTGDEVLEWSYDMKTRGRSIGFQRPAQGAINNIKRLLHQTSSPESRKRLLIYTSEKECQECQGEGLSPEARFVKLHDRRFPEISSMTILELHNWLERLVRVLAPGLAIIGEGIIKETLERTRALLNVGLHYLSMSRPLPTLSGGEVQRLRLASQLGNDLNGLIYVLDEPSIGLHPRDNRALLDSLISLRDRGNTVVVVEHDAETMIRADLLIDIGPGAGSLGGEIVSYGSPMEVMEDGNSITGQFLSGKRIISSSSAEDRKEPKAWLALKNVNINNIHELSVDVPLGVFSCITGVSGSGKSSLVIQTLLPVLSGMLSDGRYDRKLCEKIRGEKNIDRIILMDQSPIGRNPRSNPATYTGVFDEIRRIFAGTNKAKEMKYSVSHFSFNSKDGQCRACEGYGKRRIKMNFMPDIWVTCSECAGKRFNPKTLEVKYNERTIPDVLDMDVDEAMDFFRGKKKIERILGTLIDVGMGYIKLGQSAVTLSGGEAQRIKLARELSKGDTGRTMYVLDEPTTGLHFADIENLLKILHRLKEAGNTVIVIEHNLNVIYSADWVIDMGPEGGDEGGRIVAQGAPEDIMDSDVSYTGEFLKRQFG